MTAALQSEARGAESQISTSRQHDGHHSSFDVFDDLDTPTCTLKGRSINTLNIKKGPPSAGGLSFLISKSKPLRTPFAPNSLHCSFWRVLNLSAHSSRLQTSNSNDLSLLRMNRKISLRPDLMSFSSCYVSPQQLREIIMLLWMLNEEPGMPTEHALNKYSSDLRE